jgi:DNA-binding GntR family transcriptional regulator
VAELRSIRRTNLREEAIAVLREAILRGDLAPGSIHSAVSLADRLGVSATPVREAMRALIGSGLVEVLPNRGFRVTEVGEQDRDEICALRLMLEVPALARVVERAREASLAELEAAATDRDFHLGLMALAGNRRLVRIVAELHDQARIAPEALADAAAEHRRILDAIRARDTEAVVRAIETHFDEVRDRLAGHLEQVAEQQGQGEHGEQGQAERQLDGGLAPLPSQAPHVRRTS